MAIEETQLDELSSTRLVDDNPTDEVEDDIVTSWLSALLNLQQIPSESGRIGERSLLKRKEERCSCS
eukprot:6214917-Ditylum_brightwellii.AAC.1